MRVSKLPLVLLLGAVSLWAQVEKADTDKIAQFKAVFIYNFIEYVTWPTAKSTGPIVIGIIGDSDILPFLGKLTSKRKVEGRQVVIRQHPAVNDSLMGGPFSSYHILFITSELTEELEHICENMTGKNVLLIGDSSGFGQRGVAINFVEENGRLKFEINLKALDRAGLKMHAQLYKLGILIE